ncbi:hypothetical protein R3P38DRAFT_2806593 [Favolaschia claudopus]|uniref:Uncharacterized protein n=1 Tax=Favolaschia claudopus TaxID=2862362 RepID=A0AAV9ZJL2_9AGAR
MSAARTLRSHKKASSTSAPKAGQHAESKSAAQPSSTSLLKHSQQTTDEWYKAARTKNGYANYVKSGKKWLEEWTSEARLDDEIGADAFDVIAEHTPLALRALTAYKCEHLERGFSSAEGLRSAFKDYFERVCGCQGDFWKYNSHTQKWEGNPVFESGFKTYYESLKNRSTLRNNDELVNLQFKDVKMDLRSKTGIPYHEFSLIFRKTNKDPTKGMENSYGRFIRALDFVFPALASTGQVKFGEPTSRSAFETLLNDVVEKSDALHGRNGKFTTHLFSAWWCTISISLGGSQVELESGQVVGGYIQETKTKTIIYRIADGWPMMTFGTQLRNENEASARNKGSGGH